MQGTPAASPVDGPRGCVHIRAAVNTSAVHTQVHAPFPNERVGFVQMDPRTWGRGDPGSGSDTQHGAWTSS